MTFEEIKELHGMGFTPEQIISLTGKPEQPKAEPKEQPKPADNPLPGPKEQPKPADNPLPGPEQPKEDTRITELQQEVENLKKQLQKQNRQSARIETPPDDLQTQTDKIMAELIRPSIKEDKKK